MDPLYDALEALLEAHRRMVCASEDYDRAREEYLTKLWQRLHGKATVVMDQGGGRGAQ